SMMTSIRMDRNAEMEMRDGTLLRANIYRPDDGGKHPAIFLRSFDKVRFSRACFLNIFDAMEAGYAFITQDIRGRHDSDGEWKPENTHIVEGPDGHDSVEWIAGQSWCDGNVGMLGYSHAAGFTWRTAMEKPPHLKAIAPWSSGIPGGRGGSEPPDTGGVLSLIQSLAWLLNEAVDVVDRLEREGQDVTEMREALNWAVSNPEKYRNFLPLKDVPFARFERLGQLWRMRLNAKARAGGEGDGPHEKVVLPCSHLCGWYDGIGWTAIETFRIMQEHEGSQPPLKNQHLTVGPWPHGGQLLHYLGNINFGAASVGAPVSDQLIAFFDKYLKGKDIKIPAVRYFVMGRDQWQEADTWPLPQTQWQRFYLHSKGNANTSTGNGILSTDEPGSEPPDIFVYDPHRPVPTLGGSIVAAPAGFGFTAGPLDQSQNEKRNDVLCYTTPELKEDVEVSGPLEIHVFAATSARDTDFTAMLVDVHPDGRTHNVAGGIKRARGLISAHKPELITPGEVNEYIISLGHSSQLFRRGHRIRVDISSSNFPLYDRNMNTGNPIGEDAVGIPAMQTVFHQSEYASYLDLPVIPI
ncbi:CocE/NonD family hydrolase, partial [Thermodesulfobacteriota bacterium]